MDLESPVDIESAIDNLDGDFMLFYDNLRKIHDANLNLIMLDIANALNHEDWDEIDLIVTSLKPVFAQMGAGRLHFIFHFIQNAIIK